MEKRFFLTYLKGFILLDSWIVNDRVLKLNLEKSMFLRLKQGSQLWSIKNTNISNIGSQVGHFK